MKLVVLGFVLLAAALQAGGQRLESEFAARLEQLRPDEPEAYFRLAEEIADVARTEPDVALARRLFVLSFVLADEDPRATWLRPSACLAIASIERTPGRRRWLRAVASLIDSRYDNVSDTQQEQLAGMSPESRLAFAEFVGLVRAGRGAMARQRLEAPGVEAVMKAMSDVVIDDRVAPSLSRLRSEALVWPCRQCANARSVPDPDDLENGRVLCPNCRGNPGPLLTHEDLVGFVAIEAIALQSESTTWSAEHALLKTRPLRDPDADEIPSLYGIDPLATVYKSGQWERPEPESSTPESTSP